MKPLSVIGVSSIQPARDPDWSAEVPKIMRTRAPRIWCMAHAAVKKMLIDCSRTPKSIVTATALGALGETKNFLDGVFKDGFGSPRNFIASVHNSMAGKLAVDFSINGPNLTICDGQNSFASALVTASLLSQKDFPVCLVVIEERIELLDTILPYLSEECAAYLNRNWYEAAVVFLLDNNQIQGCPRISAVGPETVGSLAPEEKCALLAGAISGNGITLPPLDETSDSFVKPAIVAHNHITEAAPGTYLIGSYAPSAQAAAVVMLCM